MPLPVFVRFLAYLLLCSSLLHGSGASAQRLSAFDPAARAAFGDRDETLPTLRISGADASTGPSAGPDASADPYAWLNRYPWRASPPAQPDWQGAARDVGYYLGYQFFGVAVLYAMPESVSGWSSEDKEKSGWKEWRENTGTMIWDTDDFFINYVLHPYWGGAFYVRGRERGLDRVQAFWFGTLMSVLWEYGAEAMFEPVSIQDMVFTPTLGFLVGEYLFAPLRERIRARHGELDAGDKLILLLTDPLGALNVQVDHLFGVKTTLQLAPIGQRSTAFGFDDRSRRVARLGVHADGYRPAWGLQLRMAW